MGARARVIRERVLRWDGCINVRDLGGLPLAGGGETAYRVVVRADWLPGLGLLTIIDHGDGYLSLYGHNERLYKAVGEHVAPGDTIATSGDSGGSAHPELYFGIRKAGHAVDPVPWFKASQPGAG